VGDGRFERVLAQMEFPEVSVFDETDNEDDAAQALARSLESAGIEAPFVLTSVHGARLAARLAGPRPSETPVGDPDQKWASELGSRAHRSGADAIVAVGGGRCLDIGKLAAARAGLQVVVVPTQLSHDGICSPVAVVPDETGRTESLGALAPRLVFLAMPTLIGAPPASVRAGVGDLLANPLALRDWALAVERGLEELDQSAWDLSVHSFELIQGGLQGDLSVAAKDPEFLRRLADALVLSGTSMIVAGTSRPASGGEHEISHAIDELFGGRALHGEQVAFGCLVSTALYGDDVEAFRSQLVHLGLPSHPRDLGMSAADVVAVLLRAPDTRPGRFTVLEHADLDEPQAAALVAELWP
jgi:glycerol-1-phosphate dehydrogenase [NAD(P)+]